MKIKISTLPWNNLGPNNELITKLFPVKFLQENSVVINERCDDCDFWFVLEGFSIDEKVKVKKALIFMTTEEQAIKRYDINKLKHFDFVITSRNDLKRLGKKLIHKNYANSWFIDKTFDELLNEPLINKTKAFSTITSNLENTALHKRRKEIVQMLKTHYGNRFDVFGKGVNYIVKKEDGLMDYKFSLAIENSRYKDYFTEKIVDCFLTDTVPIYYGCPNITDYFPIESMIFINDIFDDDEIRRSIDKCLSIEGFYQDKLKFLRKSRYDYLNYYSMYAIFNSVIQEITLEQLFQPRTQYFHKDYRFDIYKKKRLNLINKIIRKIIRNDSSN
jgi:hypothetical protein